MICAAFCGTGKSYLVETYCNNFIEFECWKYQSNEFPINYINDIVSAIGKYDYIFISTNPIVLNKLHELGYAINLYYPKNELKSEYITRYINRGSSDEFVSTLDQYWDVWINELILQYYCTHTILSSGEYLQNVIMK